MKSLAVCKYEKSNSIEPDNISYRDHLFTGQGQEVVAERAMKIAAKHGHWVVLQNIHLVKKWLSSLEKNLERFAEGSHPNYRIFMSAEPAISASAHIIPQVCRF